MVAMGTVWVMLIAVKIGNDNHDSYGSGEWMNEWMKDFIKVSLIFSLKKLIGDTIYALRYI